MRIYTLLTLTLTFSITTMYPHFLEKSPAAASPEPIRAVTRKTRTPHFYTQMAIGFLANGLSQNVTKNKLIANSIGVTCALGAHLLLNSDYTMNFFARHHMDHPATEWRTPFEKRTYQLLDSIKGYAAGASLGALAREGYDAIMHYVSPYRNMTVMDKYYLLSYEQQLSIDSFWRKAAMDDVDRIQIRYTTGWDYSYSFSATEEVETFQKWAKSILEAKVDALLAQKK